MINEEKVIIKNDIDIGATIAYKDKKEKRPIVILDDVLSELDKTHKTKLVNFVSKMEQVFITATNYDDRNVNAYYVSNYKITRR